MAEGTIVHIQTGRAKPRLLSAMVAGGIIVIAALVAYHNCFAVPFVFDDIDSIVRNSTIRHLWPIWKALSPPEAEGFTVTGRPLVNLSLAVNYALGGNAPWGYHAFNLLIHILAGLALFGIVRRTLLLPGLSERFAPSALPLALAAAVCWVVHPLQTESVTYVVQRAESLMGLFYLLTLYCFIRGTESVSPRLWFMGCVIACLLGMATKEVMASAPLMVLLYDRTFIAGSFAQAWRQRWRWYSGLACTWILLAYLLVGTSGRGGTTGFGTAVPWRFYALTQCWAMVHYLRLSVWPQGLVFDYGVFLFKDFSQILPSVLLLSTILAGTLLGLVYHPRLGFLGAWFFVILAPSSTFIPVASQTIAEHRMYLPLAAVIVVVLVVGDCLGQDLWAGYGWPQRARDWAQAAVMIVLALALGMATIQRNAQYHSAESIWADVVAKRPEYFRGHADLGLAMLDGGRAAESIPYFNDALRIDPNQPVVRCNLANALIASGATNQGVTQLQETLRLTPDFSPAYVGLADVLAAQGDPQAALKHYETAIAKKPDDQAAHFNLAQLLAHWGQRERAIAQFTEVVRLDPRDATAHYNLANLLAESGREPEAISHYVAAARFDPHNARSQINLGNLFLKLGRTNDAVAVYTGALRTNPNAFKAHNNLAVILASRGDLVHAAEHFREAVRLRPGEPNLHNELAEVLDRQGLHQDARYERSEAQRLRDSGITP